MKTKHYLYISLIISVLFLNACKKLIDIELPKNQLTTDKVFADSTSANAALLNIYVIFERSQDPACNKYLSVYTDETVSANLQVYNQSRILANDGFNNSDWTALYSIIYQCNLLLEQAQSSANLTDAFKKTIQNEAKFLRGYAYFYLVNLYGKVPLITTTDVNENRVAMQSDSTTVYNQIVTDLSDARDNLPVAYQGSGKLRANKAVATALLAKVFLYQRNWSKAEELASELINSGNYTPLQNPANTFQISSNESIWQLGSQTGFAAAMADVVPTSSTTQTSYYFTNDFYSSFEPGDLRKMNWIGTNTVTADSTVTTYRFPYKYKNRAANTSSPENLIALRIAEQYLIRAESRAYQDKLTGVGSAVEDINAIRNRSGLPNVTATQFDDILGAVYLERRHEMFFENGDRFMDLKRTGLIQTVMSVSKSTWLKTAALLPIPFNEITYDGNLKQNDGY